MADGERDKWNARYAAGAYATRDHATRLLVDWLPRLAKGRALDVACGAGRNARFLAAHGFLTDGVDISEVALTRAAQSSQAQALAVRWIRADLEARPLPFAECTYDLIVCVRYVNTALYPSLIELLAPGGFLVAEQHLRTDAEVAGPRNAEYRFAPGALRKYMAGLDIVFEFEGLTDDPDGRRAALAQVIGRRSAP
jgi:tellurite methyltransferase